MQETMKTQVQSLGRKMPLEEEKATHSSILAREIPWTEKPCGLQPWGRKESDMTEPLTLFHVKFPSFGLWYVHGVRKWVHLPIHLFFEHESAFEYFLCFSIHYFKICQWIITFLYPLNVDNSMHTHAYIISLLFNQMKLFITYFNVIPDIHVRSQ